MKVVQWLAVSWLLITRYLTSYDFACTSYTWGWWQWLLCGSVSSRDPWDLDKSCTNMRFHTFAHSSPSPPPRSSSPAPSRNASCILCRTLAVALDGILALKQRSKLKKRFYLFIKQNLIKFNLGHCGTPGLWPDCRLHGRLSRSEVEPQSRNAAPALCDTALLAPGGTLPGEHPRSVVSALHSSSEWEPTGTAPSARSHTSPWARSGRLAWAHTCTFAWGCPCTPSCSPSVHCYFFYQVLIVVPCDKSRGALSCSGALREAHKHFWALCGTLKKMQFSLAFKDFIELFQCCCSTTFHGKHHLSTPSPLSAVWFSSLSPHHRPNPPIQHCLASRSNLPGPGCAWCAFPCP